MSRKKRLEHYVADLKDDDWMVRRRALKALGKQGDEAASAIADIESLLRDPNWKVRGWAARALGYLGETASTSVPLIGSLLKDKVKTVRNDACMALGMIGQAASSEIPTIISELEGGRIDQVTAMEALGGIGPLAAVYKNQLLAATENPDFTVRLVATRALYRIVGNAPELLILSEDQDTAELISEPTRLSPEELDSPVAAQRARVVESLSYHDPGAVLARIPDLLIEESSVVRRAAREAVVRLGNMVVPNLATALSSRAEPGHLDAIATALSTVGPAAAPAVSSLRVLLAHPNAMVVRSAASALGAVGGAARCAIPDLIINVSDHRASVRRGIVYALVLLAPLPSHYFGILREMIHDQDPYVRQLAQELSVQSDYEEE